MEVLWDNVVVVAAVAFHILAVLQRNAHRLHASQYLHSQSHSFENGSVQMQDDETAQKTALH